MGEGESDEKRLLRLEFNSEGVNSKMEEIQDRLDDLEKDHASQVNFSKELKIIVHNLTESIKQLHDTVGNLTNLTNTVNTGLQVANSRFSIITAILSAIGVAVIAGVVKEIFFGGA